MKTRTLLSTILAASLLTITTNGMTRKKEVPSLVKLACISLSETPAISRVPANLTKYDNIPTDLAQPIVDTILEKNANMRAFILEITGIKTSSVIMPDNTTRRSTGSKYPEKTIGYNNMLASSLSDGTLSIIDYTSTPGKWVTYQLANKATCFDAYKKDIVIGSGNGCMQRVFLNDINIIQKPYTIKLTNAAIKTIRIHKNLTIAVDINRKIYFIDTKTGCVLLSEQITIPGNLRSCLFTEDGKILKISTNKADSLTLLETIIEADEYLHNLSIKQIMALQYLHNLFTSTLQTIRLDKLDPQLKTVVESLNQGFKELLIKSKFLIF